MVELVDTQDLKSCDLKSRAGSIPALSTKWDPAHCQNGCSIRAAIFF